MDHPDLERTQALVEGAQRGDEDALDTLLRHYLPRVRRIVAGRLGRPFRREIAAISKLDHPNICTVFGASEVDGEHLRARASWARRS